MDIAITRISSKGQIVIPQEMRKDLIEGDKLLLISNEGQIILKKATKLEENMAEDLKFAKKTADALKRIGKGKKMKFNDFIDEMKKW